tara:strand:+ start:64 stop:222 length:159 start_codon:yes stop_codon:yes gene_type:complete
MTMKQIDWIELYETNQDRIERFKARTSKKVVRELERRDPDYPETYEEVTHGY